LAIVKRWLKKEERNVNALSSSAVQRAWHSDINSKDRHRRFGPHMEVSKNRIVTCCSFSWKDHWISFERIKIASGWKYPVSNVPKRAYTRDPVHIYAVDAEDMVEALSA
jgi:hypothetical protein